MYRARLSSESLTHTESVPTKMKRSASEYFRIAVSAWNVVSPFRELEEGRWEAKTEGRRQKAEDCRLQIDSVPDSRLCEICVICG
jgi:hypothetical protein